MKAENLINWGQLSRLLSGSRQTVRKNSIPKIHQEFISELLQAIDEQLSKLPDTAKSGWQKENKTYADVDMKNEQPLNLQNVMHRFIPQPSDIEKLMKEILKHRMINDEFGWTGEWRMSAKDVLDVIIDLQNGA